MNLDYVGLKDHVANQDCEAHQVKQEPLAYLEHLAHEEGRDLPEKEVNLDNQERREKGVCLENRGFVDLPVLLDQQARRVPRDQQARRVL